MKRIAVLASGGGTNLQALLDHLDALGDARSGDVVLVASDRTDARALARARARGIPAALLRTTARPEGADLAALLREHRADLVVLAGYLRLVDAAVVDAYHDRIINVHPALLPAFGGKGMFGARVHEAVIAAGASVTGATVHTIDHEYDRGRILAQWPVPVRPTDDPATLAARVLRVEHLLFPRVINAVAAGRLTAATPPRMPSGDPANLTDRPDADLARDISALLES
jgi:phosphoribosylglycinamide formyltransferase-1